MTPELAKRIAFTLGALLVYRLGTYIPVPGIDPQALGQILNDHRGALTLRRLSLFSLGLTPYFSAAIIIQLLSLISSRFNALARRGEAGRRKISRYTLGLAIALAVVQALGIAQALAGIPGIVGNAGGLFVISTTFTFAAGAIFLVWLSEQITLRGLGNGLALILCVGIVMDFAAETAATIELSRSGLLSGGSLFALIVLTVCFVAGVVFVERGRRRIPLEFAARQVGDRSVPPQHSLLALKLNNAGLMPAIVAPWFFYLPLTVAGLVVGSQEGWLGAVLKHMQAGQPGHMIYLLVTVVILALVYTAFVVDPEYASDSLQRVGAAIPGIEPGEATTNYLDQVVAYTTFAGAAYLVAVLLIPEALIAYAKVPYYFAGGSVLIVVCAVLDIEAQVRGRSLTGRRGN
jgi:preprotein translocase subunit SecY